MTAIALLVPMMIALATGTVLGARAARREQRETTRPRARRAQPMRHGFAVESVFGPAGDGPVPLS
ncbi:hypothetical protein [Nocardia australiensis]|uniref:hypothetical protein n=1 Tax=Nocardia australiensis TaxID=2887191 RepID=UPI001D159F7F|nr:hypothetical protein [Nocardia australiensis]